MQLITYVDRLAKDLPALTAMLDQHFQGLFSSVHLLPFFDPIDGADAGFDPVDHTIVDQRLGTWRDVKALSAKHSLMADLIVNHMSAESPQFRDVLERGQESEYWNLFLKKQDVFSNAEDAGQIEAIYRPRPTPPFTKKQLANGDKVDFWTTFSSTQIDINVECSEGQNYLQKILMTFSEAGIREVRLDAAGYAIKRAGSRCFMLPETFKFLQELDLQCQKLGMTTLVEIHSHYKTQIEIAEKVSRVYDFALPPLVLHALYQSDAEPLANWLSISPRNCVTVLDTHDGIGILDVAKDGDEPGLLNDQQIDSLVEGIHEKSAGESRLASGSGASNLDIYQVNCTFLDALGGNTADYLIARALQFFAPGTPQIYYVGLLGGRNDMALLQESDVGRDINRHYYTDSEVQEVVESDLVQDLFKLIRLRNSATAFSGEFAISTPSKSSIRLEWTLDMDAAVLDVDFASKTADIKISESGEVRIVQISKAGFFDVDNSIANSA